MWLADRGRFLRQGTADVRKNSDETDSTTRWDRVIVVFPRTKRNVSEVSEVTPNMRHLCAHSPERSRGIPDYL